MKTTKKTIAKYKLALSDLKRMIDNDELDTLIKWTKSSKICSTTGPTLRRLGVVIDNGRNVRFNRFEWNNKIPITDRLALSVINENYNFKMKKIPVKVTTKKVATKKVITDKKVISEVGIIRKFLRWLY